MRSALVRPLAFVVAFVTLALASLPLIARADGDLTLRGNYWRDRNTRVLAPDAVLRKTLPSGTTIEASYLLDAITSASASAGVLSDQPFTELRNEIGVRLSQVIGPATFSAMYRYSTESDYWSHTGGVGVVFDLLQKNLTLGINYVYSHSEAARRVSAIGYVWANSTEAASALDSQFLILNASQVLNRWALIDGSYEFSYLNGYQANPYRTVNVGGSPVRETVPSLRLRHTATAGLRLTPLYHAGVLDHLTLYFKYRFYTDSWGVTASTPEARVYVGLGPTELRLTGRYSHQSAATFYQGVDANGKEASDGTAQYTTGFAFPNCPTGGGTQGLCSTGDSKLSQFDSVFIEARFLIELKVFDLPHMPLGRWIGGGTLAVSAGHYWNTGFANTQYGDAWVGGLELTLPL